MLVLSLSFKDSLVELSHGILKKACTKVLSFEWNIRLFGLSFFTFIHFLFSQNFLLSFSIFPNSFGFACLSIFLRGVPDFIAEFLDHCWGFGVESSRSMNFQLDMLEVILKLFLAYLTIIGIRSCDKKFLGQGKWVCWCGFPNTTLNFFFELVFLKGGIFLIVFLY